MSRQITAGDKFGRLTALRCAGRNKWHDQLWECECECGKVKTVAAGKLKSGHTRSCGCLALDMRAKQLETHGITTGGKPRTFTIWSGMKARCLNPKSVSYPNYGGRGVGICAEWLEFKAFHEWAVSNGYADGLQLDRIDNDGNYCPDNCRWVTRSENQRNTRRTHLITLDGRTQCAAAWIKELGISKTTFYTALHEGKLERYCTRATTA